MQLAKVTHLELVLEARLQPVNHVHYICQINGVVYIYDYRFNVVIGLQNVQ